MSRFFGFAGIVALAVTFFGAQVDKPKVIDEPTSAAAPDKIGTETAPVVVPVSAPAASGCQCDNSRTPYYYSGRDNKWYPTRLFTPDEAEAENARIAKLKASEPAAAASPSAVAPVVPCRNCRKEVYASDTYCRGCGVMYPGQPVRAEVQQTQQAFCRDGSCNVGVPRAGIFRRKQ